MATWQLITCEYPPAPGGVSDYAWLVASGLAAAGEDVHVWCAGTESDDGAAGGSALRQNLSVHRELGRFGPLDLARAGRLIDAVPPRRRLLVQWVPHGYGFGSMNLAFCAWIWDRATRRGDLIDLMVHEPYLPFDAGSLKRSAVAAAHRLMAALLLNAARRVWIATPAWERCLRPYALGRRVAFEWLPVPSSIPAPDTNGHPATASAGAAAIRARYAPGNGRLIGHFGTYGDEMVRALDELLPLLLARGHHSAVLMGHGSEIACHRLLARHDPLAGRLRATGSLSAGELSTHLVACDLLVQPYPDGVTSRRTTAMAGLAHGLPIVTTSGRLTEPLWAESRAVALAPTGDLAALAAACGALLEDEAERRRMAAAAKRLYQDRFDVAHTVAALRESVKSDRGRLTL